MAPKRRKGIKPRVKDERAYAQDVIDLVDSGLTAPMVGALSSYDSTTYLNEIQLIKQRVVNDPTFGEEEARAALARMESQQRAKFERIVKSVGTQTAIFTPDANPAVKAFMESSLTDNVALIKNFAAEYGNKAYDDVAKIIRNDPFDLNIQQKAIEQYLTKGGKAGKFVKNRARLITRDQNNKVVGRLNEIRHKQVGGKKYEWLTGADERVRSNHKHLNGTTHDWNEPPVGGGTTPGERGNPGTGIQCRCVAIFLFEEQAVEVPVQETTEFNSRRKHHDKIQ